MRDGARFTCHGDGLCCSDAHLLGPLSLAERSLVEAISPSASVPDPRHRGRFLATRRGTCVFLDTRLLCVLHARLGEPAKPAMCREFPFGRIRTTLGVRVTTDHRCPCRSMGERAPIRAEDVPPGAVSHAPGRIALDARTRVPFARYARDHEAPLVEALRAGREGVLGAPFPELDGVTWREVAELFRAMKDGVPYGTSLGEALVAFGDTIRHVVERREGLVPVRERPWADSFERAEARSPVAGDPDEMLGDFAADELWTLDFAIRETSLAVARAELATRLAVARAYAAGLAGAGVRADRAMAEAILVAELAGRSEVWMKLQSQFVLPGSRYARAR